MESILIVDDDPNLCVALKEELSEVGYETEFVKNGFDAINFIADKPVDLIILDLKIPDMDGFGVLNEIERRRIASKVIVLTAYADVQSIVDSAKLGASDFLSKPYDFDELLITIRKVLQKD